MNTQSHAIINLFLLRKIFSKEKTQVPYFNSLAILGSVLPDIPMFFFFIYYAVLGTSQQLIWNNLYFENNWQIFFNLFNSIPLFLIVAMIAVIAKKRGLLVFALANIFHFLGDIFVHQEDAHAHFFPLSNWKFNSPVSYWDPGANGNYFSIFETLLVLVISVFLWREIKSKWGKALIVFVNAFNIFNWVMWYVVFNVF